MPAVSVTAPADEMRVPIAETTSVARASVHAANHCVPEIAIAGVASARTPADTAMLFDVAARFPSTSAPNTSKLVVANVRLSCQVTKHVPPVEHDTSGNDCVAVLLLIWT